MRVVRMVEGKYSMRLRIDVGVDYPDQGSLTFTHWSRDFKELVGH